MNLEKACEIMHDAYELAAVDSGWETQEASRKPWADVPEANKETMRAAVRALLAEIEVERLKKHKIIVHSDTPMRSVMIGNDGVQIGNGGVQINTWQ